MKIKLSDYIGTKKYRYAFDKRNDVGMIDTGTVIAPTDREPRQFDPEKLRLLGEDILNRGQLQPIRVYWSERDGKWVIIAGERRWRAIQLVGMFQVMCVFVAGPMTPEQIIAERLADNLLHETPDPLEIARNCQELMRLTGWTTRQVADHLHVDHSVIVKAMALLRLPEQVQAKVESGEIAPSTAYEVSKVKDEEKQVEIAEQVVANGMTRNETAEVVRRAAGKPSPARKPSKSASADSCKRAMRTSNGLTITVTSRRKLTDEQVVDACREFIEVIRNGQRDDRDVA